MLTMFGFIKKELKDSGDLRLKYKGYVGQLYNYNSIVNSEENLQKHSFIRPYNPKNPMDWSKPWEITAKVKIAKTYSATQPFIHVGLRNYDSTDDWCVAKFDRGIIYAAMKNVSTDQSGIRLSSSVLANGIWLRASHTSGTNVSLYYSTDGKTYKLIKTYSYSNINRKDTHLEVVSGGYSADCSISAKDIRFTYNGKLMFAKVE